MIAEKMIALKKNLKAFCVEWITGYPETPIDRRRVTVRLCAIGLVALFYAYEIAWWYNTDMKELNNIAGSKAQVGKEFKRRENLIANLDVIVNNYAMHEKVLFEHVSDMRSLLRAIEMLGRAPSSAQGAKVEKAFLELSALAEQYPDLKAEKRFHDLMDMAEITENRIAENLNVYTEAVWDFNTCNQRLWCNYFTYPISGLVPLPAYWEYYHTDNEHVPSILSEQDLLEKENEVIKNVS